MQQNIYNRTFAIFIDKNKITDIFIFATIFLLFSIINLFFVVPQIFAYSVNENELLNLTNQKRQENNKPVLTINSSLSNAAQMKANDMITKNYFAHLPPGSSSVWVFVDQSGYTYSSIAENLAEGYDTSGAVINAWMNSSGHRANMLGDYKDAGFGIAEGMLNGRNTVVVVGEYGTPSSYHLQIQSTDTPTPTPTGSPFTNLATPTPTPLVIRIPTSTPTPTLYLSKIITATPTYNSPKITTIPTITPQRNNINIDNKATLESMKAIRTELEKRREAILLQLKTQNNIILHSTIIIV